MLTYGGAKEGDAVEQEAILERESGGAYVAAEDGTSALDLPAAEAEAFAAVLAFCDEVAIEAEADRHAAVQVFDGFMQAVLQLFASEQVMHGPQRPSSLVPHLTAIWNVLPLTIPHHPLPSRRTRRAVHSGVADTTPRQTYPQPSPHLPSSRPFVQVVHDFMRSGRGMPSPHTTSSHTSHHDVSDMPGLPPQALPYANDGHAFAGGGGFGGGSLLPPTIAAAGTSPGNGQNGEAWYHIT